MARISGGTVHVMTVLPDQGINLVGHYFPEGTWEEAAAAAREEL